MREIKRFESPRAAQKLTAAQNSFGCCTKTRRASVNPPNKSGPNFFSLFATLRPSTSNDKGQINETYRVSVSPRYHRILADRALPDGGLANRHLADHRSRLRLIDGLRVRKVGRASDGHEGKRCARYDQSFHHGLFPLGMRKQSSNLLTFPSDIPTL
jgi:hypothetical protein